MDEISLLRRARTDIPERNPASVARGRATLFAQIEAETPYAPFAALGDDTSFTPLPVRRRRRRTVAWTGVTALGAGALTIALIGGNVFGVGGWHGGADPAAADMLNAAAVATLEVTDPQLAPGQYLRVRNDAEYMTQAWLDEDVDAARVNGEVQDLNTVEPQYYMSQERMEVFRPSDRNDTWWRIQCRRSVAQTFGPKSALAAQEDLSMADGPIGQLIEMPGGRINYELPDGGVKVSDPPSGFSVPGGLSDDFSQLPLEPGELLAEIYRLTAGTGPSPDGEALVWIADTLRGGAVPAEFRAAMYQAAALIPGVSITDEQATLNGRTGTAIGRDETNNNFRQEIIFDPATGQFIGERTVALEGYGAIAVGAALAAGTTVAWTAVTTEIVDAAPTDVSTCSA
ncbi:RNA polymerase sigma-70 factor (ECF subfamily) [Microbacterium resistens]|uniref:RNA polymerase sigma-70 factor (ECF subfamily) n=1 Tax=Microbacterium resistens TaxID=156977 RepID=A0ABU1SHG2_9MICO|nr:CU044_5270 family protein [Microbacterium resistens]MDR6868999.1 RNA polymerase sigma-70 factor (ECF subfamily) [Microbacterium resistens]